MAEAPHHVKKDPSLPLSAAQSVSRGDAKLDDNQLTLIRSRIASLSEERSPYLGYCGRYNKEWYVDVVVLPNNSLRKQLNRLFISTNSLGKMAVDVSEATLKRFYQWYAEFHSFMQTIFDAEEVSLYPFLDSLIAKNNETLPHSLYKDERLKSKKEIVQRSIDLQNTFETEKPSPEIVESLRDAADNMSVVLLRYLSLKEDVIIKIVRQHGRPGDKLTVEQSMVQHLIKQEPGLRHLDFLLSSLEKPSVRHDFLKKNIGNLFKRRKVEKQLSRSFSSSEDSIHHSLKEASEKYSEKYSVATFLNHYGATRDEDTEVIAEMKESVSSGLR